ncbi:MAG: type II secretion system major pseudopilin GspG [Candidatus Tectomicrobia bacterium]|nr:type II secretion system major pseudopilin GspG [Candidatus Tectomicrobia bacterium]
MRPRNPLVRLLKDDHGVTFIEIIVVIIIIGILATFVAPKVFSWVDQARQAQARNQIASFNSALRLFYLDNGFYPSSEQGLKALVEKPTVGRTPSSYRPGGYIEKTPVDPWGNSYVYRPLDDGRRYEIKSLGADGQQGGEGNDADISSEDLG